MKLLKKYIGMLILLSVSIKGTAIDKNPAGFYCGRKPGILSTALVYLQIRDSIAVVHQYREFGAVPYHELSDTCYRQDGLFLGTKVFVYFDGTHIRVKNRPKKSWYRTNVKMKVCAAKDCRKFDEFRNRIILDTISFKGLTADVYHPLIDKAYQMSHEAFKRAVDTFINKYPNRY